MMRTIHIGCNEKTKEGKKREAWRVNIKKWCLCIYKIGDQTGSKLLGDRTSKGGVLVNVAAQWSGSCLAHVTYLLYIKRSNCLGSDVASHV